MNKNKILTLAFILNHETQEILLGYKKRGFGVGRWNGFGGKVTNNESIMEGAQRELKEEAGISCLDFRFVGLISFEFKGNPEIFQVHLFKGYKYDGIVQESEEMRPAWYKIKEIPYVSMWVDDKFWLPLLLNDKIFYGYFLFEEENKILEYNINILSNEELRKKQKDLINFDLI